MYDLTTDPYQMENVYEAASGVVRRELHLKLAEYWQCKGQSCP
jgi:hypothetical protein